MTAFRNCGKPASRALEGNHEEQQNGPGRDAYETGQVIRVTDVRQESAHWPEFSATAARLGVAGVAGIPMRLADQIIGALNLYSSQPRECVHKDVRYGIPALSVLDTRLVTFSNGAAIFALRLLERAGLGKYFERDLSVEDAGVWKPAPGAYAYAAQQ